MGLLGAMLMTRRGEKLSGEGLRRFQLAQKGPSLLELRVESEDRESAFRAAAARRRAFLEEQGAPPQKIVLSPDPPRPDPVSGKYKHLCRE